MMRRSAATYSPDVIILTGASHSMCSGSKYEEFTDFERADLSSLICSVQTFPDTNWASPRRVPAGLGGMPYTLPAAMRRLGMRPATMCYSQGGTGSWWWHDNAATAASWLKSRFDELHSPNLRALVTYEGDDEAAGYHPYSALQSNWQTFYDAVCSSFSVTELPWIVCKNPDVVIPGSGTKYTYITEVRAAQEALVAANSPYAHAVEHPSAPQFVADGQHYTADTDREMSTVIARIIREVRV